jgi:hypothetical protein
MPARSDPEDDAPLIATIGKLNWRIRIFVVGFEGSDASEWISVDECVRIFELYSRMSPCGREVKENILSRKQLGGYQSRIDSYQSWNLFDFIQN